MPAKAIPIEERLVLKLNKTNDCWLYTGQKNHNGYGIIALHSQSKRAHRVAYELWVGPIPEGLLVCHECDVPSCCNPDHLFVGTHKENMQDSLQKGRYHSQKITHCPQGHEYSLENTYNGDGLGRKCRTCRAIVQKKIGYRDRRKDKE